jgi:hypothetical protein
MTLSLLKKAGLLFAAAWLIGTCNAAPVTGWLFYATDSSEQSRQLVQEAFNNPLSPAARADASAPGRSLVQYLQDSNRNPYFIRAYAHREQLSGYLRTGVLLEVEFNQDFYPLIPTFEGVLNLMAARGRPQNEIDRMQRLIDLEERDAHLRESYILGFNDAIVPNTAVLNAVIYQDYQAVERMRNDRYVPTEAQPSATGYAFGGPAPSIQATDRVRVGHERRGYENLLALLGCAALFHSRGPRFEFAYQGQVATLASDANLCSDRNTVVETVEDFGRHKAREASAPLATVAMLLLN